MPEAPSAPQAEVVPEGGAALALRSADMEQSSQGHPPRRRDHAAETRPEWSVLVAEGRAKLFSPGPNRIKRFARWFYDRFVRLHGSPNQIAWGAALGLFVAMSPTMGFQMAIVIPIAAFFRISKVAAAAAVWLTNPATAPFIYWLNYKLGAMLLGYPVKAGFLANPSWEAFWHAGRHALLSLTVGGLITGIGVAISGYVITSTLVTTARNKAARLQRKKQRASSTKDL